ncbi:peptidase T [Campylobacter estrildidarum]|uniref:Peptidase T n=1 Tax=Campylobacter estrildidarum TaxID=2510189 RepID=A0A4U7BG87_9BACT|nr:peptidase T [Campylobacter estrildidarum]TKX30698.1 peptidase T [Campylobacter estrildidarum]
MDYKQIQINNFFRYLAIPSQSNAKVQTLPSSKGQYDLALLLKKELEKLGLNDILLQDNAILTAKLKGNSNKKSIGFCAHLDTVDVGLSDIVKPQILKFEGKALCLNKEKNIICDPKEHPELLKYINEEIIFSDGTSVLGADNKAAIATIMTLLQYLVEEKCEHGDIYVSFVPDEEIGLRGSKMLDLKHFNPEFAFTIDCCELGELVFETFNAGSAFIEIQGISAHPMSAKGVLLNPTLIGIDIANCFDRLQTPENTENDEGYIWVQEFHSNQISANLLLNIRDHNKEKYEKKKAYIKEVVEFMQKRYERAKISLKIEDTYSNLKDSINENNKIALEVLEQAFCVCDIKPKTFPMRGGTDGSALALKGLFVPNFFTGAHNFHSAFEFLPLKSFYRSFEVAKNIVEIV